MKIIILIALFSLIDGAFGQIDFNNISYRGSGCPAGSVATVVTPDGSSLSVLFDEFRAEVPDYGEATPLERSRGTTSSPAVSHRSCALSFTATLSPGVMAESLEIFLDARGATILDEGVEGFFASILVGYEGLARSKGRPSIIARKNWRAKTGPIDETWLETPRSIVPLLSGCSGPGGKDIRFDLKNHVKAEITDGDLSRSGLISVDSNDVRGMLKFRIHTRRCGGGRLSP